MRARALSIAVCLGLAACATPVEGPEFRSEQERACYMQARADLTGPDQQLRRGQDGWFIVATIVSGFLRDVDRSPTFDACMGSAMGPAGTTQPRLSAAAPVTFTPAEQAIWNRLDDDTKRAALAAIQQGSTLTAFVSTQ